MSPGSLSAGGSGRTGAGEYLGTPTAFRLVNGNPPFFLSMTAQKRKPNGCGKKSEKILPHGFGVESGRGSQKSRVGDGWKRRPLQRGATEPDSRSSPGRPVGVHLPQSEPRQDNVKKREGNPGAAVVGPRQDAAQGRCETLSRVPAGIIWDGRNSVPGFGGRSIGSSCSGWLVNTETLAGVHGHRLEERHTEMDPEAGPTEAFSSKKNLPGAGR